MPVAVKSDHIYSNGNQASSQWVFEMGSGPGEGAAGLRSGWVSAGDPAGHAGDGGPADEGLGDFGLAFVVAGQSAVGGQPRQGPLHYPATRLYSESSLVGGF